MSVRFRVTYKTPFSKPQARYVSSVNEKRAIEKLFFTIGCKNLEILDVQVV